MYPNKQVSYNDVAIQILDWTIISWQYTCFYSLTCIAIQMNVFFKWWQWTCSKHQSFLYNDSTLVRRMKTWATRFVWIHCHGYQSYYWHSSTADYSRRSLLVTCIQCTLWLQLREVPSQAVWVSGKKFDFSTDTSTGTIILFLVCFFVVLFFKKNIIIWSHIGNGLMLRFETQKILDLFAQQHRYQDFNFNF